MAMNDFLIFVVVVVVVDIMLSVVLEKKVITRKIKDVCVQPYWYSDLRRNVIIRKVYEWTDGCQRVPHKITSPEW